MYCKECGEITGDNAKFCPNCGTKQADDFNYIESKEKDVEIHNCPLCASILAPILNSNGKQFGSVCLKCDPDINNNSCPVCRKTMQFNKGADNCTSCGYSWRLPIIRNDGMFNPFPEPFNKAQNTTESEPLKCPKCRSTDLTANKKGYRLGNAVAGLVLTGGIGLLGGFVGSNKVKVTCLKCGNNWEAGKQ